MIVVGVIVCIGVGVCCVLVEYGCVVGVEMLVGECIGVCSVVVNVNLKLLYECLLVLAEVFEVICECMVYWCCGFGMFCMNVVLLYLLFFICLFGLGDYFIVGIIIVFSLDYMDCVW